MEPRLKTSRKWTALPKEFLIQVQGVFKQSFAKEIGRGSIEVEGKIFPEEVLIRVSYKTPGSLKQSGFDISIAYKVPKDNVLTLLHTAVDAGASLMEQLFTANDDGDFPLTWEEVQFEKRTIYVKYSTTNSELESEANKLLGLGAGEDELAQGDWDEDESPETIKTRLGLSDDEEDDFEDEEADDEVPAKPAKAPPKRSNKKTNH